MLLVDGVWEHKPERFYWSTDFAFGKLVLTVPLWASFLLCTRLNWFPWRQAGTYEPTIRRLPSLRCLPAHLRWVRWMWGQHQLLTWSSVTSPDCQKKKHRTVSHKCPFLIIWALNVTNVHTVDVVAGDTFCLWRISFHPAASCLFVVLYQFCNLFDLLSHINVSKSALLSDLTGFRALTAELSRLTSPTSPTSPTGINTHFDIYFVHCAGVTTLWFLKT